MKDELESMIDSSSVLSILRFLEEICYEKAEHLESNWQDRSAARQWQKAGSVLDKAIAKLPNQIGIDQ